MSVFSTPSFSPGISTFLVTNAQFPDAIKNLRPVTQLYVSVDAATKDSLKKIDRPLFKDFWERWGKCGEGGDVVGGLFCQHRMKILC